MALDATVGGTTANSFLTVARANLVIQEGRVSASAWATAAEAQRAASLVGASQLLSHGFNWNGTRASTTQALPFPRTGIVSDGVTISNTTIPRAIEEAVIDIAFGLLSGAAASSGELQKLGLSVLKVDVIRLEASDQPANVSEIPDRVSYLLREYGTNVTGTDGAFQTCLRRS